MDLQVAKDREVENGSAFGAVNFDFAFNNMDYSDCVLRIKVLSASWEGEAMRYPSDMPEFDGYSESVTGSPDFASDVIKGKRICLNRYEEPEIQSVSTIHVNSLLLSAHSPFFRKLFTNGMRESKLREATLCVSASEEAPVKDLLRYIYYGRVQANTGQELLGVIEVAEKFGAVYCIQYCVRLLLIAPMNMDLALMCMQLPTAVLQNEAVEPLAEAATTMLIDHFKDFKRSHLQALSLPLEGVKAVLSSDQIEVDSEDEIYEFVMSWARTHYPNNEERTKVLANSLIQLIRFPMMTNAKLRCLQEDKEIDALVSQFVSEAFIFKAELLHKQKQMGRGEGQVERFTERAYKKIPVKVIEFEKPYRHFLLYFNIRKKECASLSLQGQLLSECFDLELGTFYLICQRVSGVQQEMFRLDVRLQNLNTTTCKVECKFAARSKAMRLDFYHLHSTTHTYKGGESGVGLVDPFKTYWSSFVAETSPYFIDDTLCLRIEMAYV